jgi:hypothetical protein
MSNVRPLNMLTKASSSRTIVSVARWFGVGALVAFGLWLSGSIVTGFGIEAQVALNRLRYTLWPTAILLFADPLNSSLLMPLVSIVANGVPYAAARMCWIAGTGRGRLAWLPMGLLLAAWAFYVAFLYRSS